MGCHISRPGASGLFERPQKHCWHSKALVLEKEVSPEQERSSEEAVCSTGVY